MRDAKDWVKNEIELACKREISNSKEKDDWSYGCECYKSAYKAYLSLLEDCHSGLSIVFTKQILNRLIDGKPLTPIEDTEDNWEFTPRKYNKNGIITYQCKRMSSLFKDVFPDGTVKYHDNNMCCCTDIHDNKKRWYNGFISNIIHEKYPITMPYYPTSKPYVVYCSECLSDPKNGDFDTIGLWYIIKPDGTREDINRFFKENETSWTEISREEYLERANLGGNKDE